MNARASIATGLLGAAVVFGSGGARAQTGTPSPAEAAFRDGRQAATAGDWASACPKFAESERLEPAPGTLLNLADCEAHIGKLMSAREHFDLAASAFPRTDKRHAIAADRAAALEKRLVHLTLRLAADAPPDAVVRSGATVVDHATFGQAALADPGALTIVVSASGHADRSYPLVLQEGSSVDQTVDVGPVAAPVTTTSGATTGVTTTASSTSAPPPSDSAPRSHTQRTLGMVLGGVGAVSLIVGGVTGILAIGKASTVKSHCDASDACDQQGVDAGDSGKVLAPVSTVTLIAGAALLAAGAYFYFFGDKTKATQTAIVPVASPYGGGAVFLQSF